MSQKRTEQVAGIAVISTRCDFEHLPSVAKQFVEEKARICQPKDIYICDGSNEEKKMLLEYLVKIGQIQKLDSMNNCWLAITDPKDVARVESRTFISTDDDYLQRVDARLIAVTLSDGRRQSLVRSWPGIIKELMEDDDFGVQLKKNIPRTI